MPAAFEAFRKAYPAFEATRKAAGFVDRQLAGDEPLTHA